MSVSTISLRAALAGAALTLLLTASGCAATPEPAPTVTVTVAPTSSPEPTVEPTTDPEPDPAADAGDPSTWVIGFAGIGPFVVGSTLADIEADLPHPPETCRPGVDTYDLDGLGLTAVSGIDESDPAAPVQVVRMLGVDGFDPASQPRTEEGIGIGSTIAELQAARPDVESYQGMGGQTVYRILADGRSVQFEDGGTGTIQIISVVEGISVASEYCGA